VFVTFSRFHPSLTFVGKFKCRVPHLAKSELNVEVSESDKRTSHYSAVLIVLEVQAPGVNLT
jgi:hypothetical protein